MGEADADSIAEFIRAAAWDPGATPESVREVLRTTAAGNPFEPGAGPPTVGVFMGARLVGYVTSIPARFWNGKGYASAYWIKGWWVLEEYRNSPIGFLLLKELLRHVGLVASMPAARLPRQLSEALGMRDLGAVRDYLAPLQPARILRKLDIERLEHLRSLPGAVLLGVRVGRIAILADLIGALITLGLTTLRLPTAMAGRGLTARLDERLPSEAALDGLWSRARRVLSACATRSGAYLRWRYERTADGHYHFATVWRGDELAGLAVLAHPQRPDDSRLAGVRIGSVVDLVLDPDSPGALPRLLAAARRWGRGANYDALLLTASRRALRRPLLRAGYIPVPGNLHLLLRDPGAAHGLSTDLDLWMVTRGDAWGDHL